MPRVLIATADPAGAPVGIGAELRRRGHDVRVLAPPATYPTVAAAGLGFAALVTPLAPAAEIRALDPRLGVEMLAELGRRPSELVVVDARLLTVLKAAPRSGAPVAVLVAGRFSDAAQWARGPVRTAARLRRVRPAKLWDAAARVLVAAAAELDPEPLPGNAVRTGPVIGPVRVRAREPEALVVVEGVPVPDGIAAEQANPDTLSRAWLYLGDGSHDAAVRALANDLPVVLGRSPFAEAVAATGAGRVLGGDPAADVAALLADGPHQGAAAALGARIRAAAGAAHAADALEALLPG